MSKLISDLTLSTEALTSGVKFEMESTLGLSRYLTSTFFIDLIYPIGIQYRQVASVASSISTVAFPSSESPSSLLGGTWTALWSTENVFFRTEGTDYQSRTSGLSADQIENHWHQVNREGGSQKVGAAAGAGSDYGFTVTSSQTVDSFIAKTIITDGVYTPRTGAVTEPRNRLERVWKRTA